MKRLFLFAALAVFALASCNSDNADDKKVKFTVDTDATVNRGESNKMDAEMKQLAAMLDAHIDAEVKSGKVHKEAFPGYDFGMNERKITRKTKKLARKGEVEKYRKAKKRTYAYAYLMPLMGEDVPAFIDFVYNEKGEMFKGEGIIDVPKGSSSMDILNLTTDLFKEWYGQPAFDLPQYNYCQRHIWVDGNRMIDLRCEVDGVAFSFYNLNEETPNLFEVTTPQEDNNSEDDNPLIQDEPADDEQNIQTH
jgi:hypothetical protein